MVTLVPSVVFARHIVPHLVTPPSQSKGFWFKFGLRKRRHLISRKIATENATIEELPEQFHQYQEARDKSFDVSPRFRSRPILTPMVSFGTLFMTSRETAENGLLEAL